MKRLLIPTFSLLIFFSCSRNPSKIDSFKKIDNVFYDKAFKFRDTVKVYDSAFYYFNKAKELFIQKGDSLGAGKCLLNMAIIAEQRGDNFRGQEISLDASSYFDEKKKEHLTYIKSNLNNLGITSFNLKDYDKAIEFYEQSLKFADDSSALVIENNIANAYSMKKDYKKSQELYEEILAKKIKNKKEFARSLTNRAINRWILNSNYDAIPQLLEALQIRIKENDLLGQNSSYAHLADFYAKKRPDSALLYAIKMYKVAKDLQSVDDQLEALHKLVILSPEQSTKSYFNLYQKLDDSLQTARNKAKNQFALIRYDAEKHKAESLKFQKENVEKTYVVVSLIILLGGGIFWYRKRKQRLEMETQNAISESELKTSKKVHDVVANGLYRVMTKVEHENDIDKEHLLDEIEELYEKSRDISYEKPITSAIDFHQKIAELLKSFNSASTKVSVTGNNQELWRKADRKAKDEVWHILQELMVNMSKHSQATQVTLRFENVQENIHVLYEDNGIGMGQDKEFNNGLRNTETRIKNLKGQLTFETKLEKGLKIHLKFPVS